MFLKGFRFGLILQFAVGPVCLFIVSTAGAHGFFAASLASVAVTVVDGLYILLAGLGVCSFLRNPRVAKFVRIGGGVVLLLFGLDLIASAFGTSLLPTVRAFQTDPAQGVFWKAAVMTASNPLTVLFWGGVLSTNIANENMNRQQLGLFGLGCVAATFVFLHLAALAGAVMGAFLPEPALALLSAGVGVFIIFFGFRMLMPQKEHG